MQCAAYKYTFIVKHFGLLYWMFCLNYELFTWVICYTLKYCAMFISNGYRIFLGRSNYYFLIFVYQILVLLKEAH